ncbi:MAG: glycosyltransferase family 2 protein [Terriglobales bacterium]
MKTDTREPVLDIVVLTHSQDKWLKLCISAIESFTINPYRLILVDSAASPECNAVLAEAEKRGHTVLHLAENRSFSNGVNAGLALGKAKYVAILNDDIIVTEHWDMGMIETASLKNVGIVGAQTNFASGPMGDPGFVGKVPYLVFCCVAMRRHVWETLGGLDGETFDGFSTEDIDMSWRAIKAGLELKVCKSTYVYHVGHRTLGTAIGGQDDQRRNNERYFNKLHDKWGGAWVQKMSTIEKPRVMVATFHAEEWTRVQFMGSLWGLKKSDNAPIGLIFPVTRLPIHAARQLACDYATDNGFSWILMLDDDATFPSDVLRRLLAHEKQMVVALAYQRRPPHATCVFRQAEDGTLAGAPMEGIEHTGLRRVDITGLHCALINTDIIRKLREGLTRDGKVIVPGTRQYFGGFENQVGEDVAFSINLKKLGIQIHCDTELIAGHIGSNVVVDEDYKKRYLAGQGVLR